MIEPQVTVPVNNRGVSRLSPHSVLRNVHPLSVLSIVGFFVIWYVATSVLHLIDPAFLPSPTSVFPTAGELLATGELQQNILVSLQRILLGFALATVLGVSLGLLMGLYEAVADIVEPLANLVRQIPPVAWLPLALIWFGFGEGSKIYIVFIGSFFPILINTADAVGNVDRRVLQAASSLGASGAQLFLKVSLPAALPGIFTGLTVGLGNAFHLIVAAELGGAFAGVGYMMLAAREMFRTDIVILGMVILMILGTVLMMLMLWLRARLLRWHAGLSGR